MTNQPDVTVRLDDRIRLMSAVLAATDWPDKSQERKPHGTHAHSRATRKFLESVKTHEAVQNLQSVLNQGAPLEAIFSFAMQLSWPDMTIAEMPRWAPPKWNEQLRDFYEKSRLTDWWRNEDNAWQSSLNESKKMFKDVVLKPFLKPFFGEITESLLFIPNISYPTDQEVGLHLPGQLVAISAPRLAWGDSPPWPFDEDPAHVYRAAISEYGRLILQPFLRANAEKVAPIAEVPLPVNDQFKARYPTWEEQFITLYVAAVTALYLESHINKAEANSFVLMARKTQGMLILPGMISVIRRYQSEAESGRYPSLIDFLPIFPKQLRVANRIVTL
jgi:hypothetical protein